MFKSIVTLVAAVGALALAGCATHPQNQTAAKKTAQQSKTHMVCFSTTPLGTHMPKTHCMTMANYKAYKKQQKEQGKKDRQSVIDLDRQTTPTGQMGGGGL